MGGELVPTSSLPGPEIRRTDVTQPFEEDFCEAAYTVGGRERTLQDAWSGDHMGFYSSLAAVNRTSDPGRRSYAATGYLRPNLTRSNLKVLCEALASRIVLDGKTATGVEFIHGSQRYTVPASKEVILSGGVMNSPQLLELSGIGDPDVLRTAGVECKVENKRVGANFQDHVLGGMLYDLKDGLQSLDSLHNAEYAKAQSEIYAKTGKGPYGSPGMLMGFTSYASLVDQQTLEKTIADVRKHSMAETEFEKRQEDIVVRQLSDPDFANIQTFCTHPRPVVLFPALALLLTQCQASAANSTSAQAKARSDSSHHLQRTKPVSLSSSALSTRSAAVPCTLPPQTRQRIPVSTRATSATRPTPRSWRRRSGGWIGWRGSRCWGRAWGRGF